MWLGLTVSKSLHSPRSTGPTLRPSSSMMRMPVLFSSFLAASGIDPPCAAPLMSASGACTKQVKCRSVSRLDGGTVWPELAVSAWMLANKGVVVSAWARSAGVLSIQDEIRGC